MTIESYIDASVVYSGSSSLAMGVGIVAVIEGRPLERVHISERFGLLPGTESADNNQAEYVALLSWLGHALRMGCKKLTVYSDSDLVVKHLHGKYICRSKFEKLYWACCERIKHFEDFEIVHIKRTKNGEADALAKKALYGSAEKIDPSCLL